MRTGYTGIDRGGADGAPRVPQDPLTSFREVARETRAVCERGGLGTTIDLLKRFAPRYLPTRTPAVRPK